MAGDGAEEAGSAALRLPGSGCSQHITGSLARKARPNTLGHGRYIGFARGARIDVHREKASGCDDAAARRRRNTANRPRGCDDAAAAEEEHRQQTLRL